MRIFSRSIFFCAILGLAGSFAPTSSAQPSPQLPPDDSVPSASAVPERCKPAAGAKNPVLSDTQGVDFKMYLGQVKRITNTNWKPLVPKVAERPFRKEGEVIVCFAILPNGRVEPGSMVLTTRSGDASLDRAAWGAIQTAIYPPLPEAFHGPRLQLTFAFEYNNNRCPDAQAAGPKVANLRRQAGGTLGYTSSK